MHHQLRSVARGELHCPRTTTRRLGPRSFTSSAPTVWNTLPSAIRDSHSLTVFKQRLKSHLFNIAYLMTIDTHACIVYNINIYVALPLCTCKRGVTNAFILLLLLLQKTVNVSHISHAFFGSGPCPPRACPPQACPPPPCPPPPKKFARKLPDN
jgi:hypothetical protein